MPHTWYLAVDMHLFILSPIFVYLLWRWKRLGLVSVVGFTLASLAATFTLYAVFDFPPTMMITRMKDFSKSSSDFMDYYYFKFWTRAPPYMVGIFIGWFLHVTKGSSMKINKVGP